MYNSQLVDLKLFIVIIECSHTDFVLKYAAYNLFGSIEHTMLAWVGLMYSFRDGYSNYNKRRDCKKLKQMEQIWE